MVWHNCHTNDSFPASEQHKNNEETKKKSRPIFALINTQPQWIKEQWKSKQMLIWTIRMVFLTLSFNDEDEYDDDKLLVAVVYFSRINFRWIDFVAYYVCVCHYYLFLVARNCFPFYLTRSESNKLISLHCFFRQLAPVLIKEGGVVWKRLNQIGRCRCRVALMMMMMMMVRGKWKTPKRTNENAFNVYDNKIYSAPKSDTER